MLLIAAITAAMLIGGGIAYASIPAADGTVNGCRKNTDGSLRAIDSAATCPNGWTALNWNQPYTFYSVSNGPFNVPPAGGVIAAIGCNTGDQVVAGGADNDHGATDLFMFMGGSFPMADGRWQVQMTNTDQVNFHSFDIYAMCAHRG
jgi:hypothetical protein